MGFFDFLKPKPKLKLPPEAEKACKQIAFVAFPGGRRQIEEETAQLHALLRGRLTKKEAGHLLQHTKFLLVLDGDKSEARVTASILVSTNGKLSQHEAHLVYVFLTGMSGPATAGGDGSSAENAVVINATSSIVGVHEEYAYVERVCGTRDVDWSLVVQGKTTENGRDYDVLSIRMKDGSTRDFWFDITAFFGRF